MLESTPSYIYVKGEGRQINPVFSEVHQVKTGDLTPVSNTAHGPHEWIEEGPDAPGWNVFVCTVCGIGKRVPDGSTLHTDGTVTVT